MSSSHQVAGHHLTLLRNGQEYFPRLLAAIHAAQQSIYLETYIFASDEIGKQVMEALTAAAARDVDVHVLLDGFGAANFPAAWQEEMRLLGVKVLWFRPELTRYRMFRQRMRRLHRKLVMVDERVAFVGGINIIDDLSGHTQAPRLDYAVEVQGEVVAQISYYMRRLWQIVSWTNLHRSGARIGRQVWKRHAQKEVTFLIRNNLRHRRDIEHAYLHAISHAKHEIIIANAYFLPGRRFRKVLLNAARRGVRVVLLLQGKADHPLLHYATLALFEELLQAGIEIHSYTRSFLHAKVAVVDGRWATVGSSNIDPFSLWLAREANLMVRDSGFAGALRESLLQEMTHGAHTISKLQWHRQNLWARMQLRASYAFVRLLAGISGYAHRQDDI